MLNSAEVVVADLKVVGSNPAEFLFVRLHLFFLIFEQTQYMSVFNDLEEIFPSRSPLNQF